jgi:hypothetical protein
MKGYDSPCSDFRGTDLKKKYSPKPYIHQYNEILRLTLVMAGISEDLFEAWHLKMELIKSVNIIV